MEEKPPARERLRDRPILLAVLLTVMAILAGLVFWQLAGSHSPVPKTIKQKVNFPIYYPDSAKLPPDYSLDSRSFAASDQVVIYKVLYKGRDYLVFTVQPKPSDSELALFNKNQIPLHKDVLTLVGTASIGAIGQQTVVSLPTNGQSWLLITAPTDINQTQLTKILQSIKKSD